MPIDKMLSWLPWGFVVFGILFLIVGIRTIVGSTRRRESWRIYPGRVVGSKLNDGQFQSQVAYTVDGREIIFWNRFTSTSMLDPVGREVEVLVNPEDVDDAVVGKGMAGGGAAGVGFLVFGVLAVVVGSFLLRNPFTF